MKVKSLSFIVWLGVMGITKGQLPANCLLKINLDNAINQVKSASLTINYFDRDSVQTIPLAMNNGTAVFKKNLKEPVLAFLDIAPQNRKAVRYRFFLPVDSGELFIDAGNKLKIVFKNQQALFDTFSLYEKQINDLNIASKEAIRNVNFENRSELVIQNEIDSIDRAFQQRIDQEVYLKNIGAYTHSFLGVHALLNYAERPYEHQRRKFETDSILRLYHMFSAEMQALPSMQSLFQLLQSEKKIGLGGTFPSFIAANAVGRQVAADTFYGTYTLIDFWASWCTPCRAEHPNLRDQYAKYKAKGFAIISISIDKIKDKNLWISAIDQDKVGLWPHLIDVKQTAKEQLHIRFIPANFLIDKTGKIIARDLSGAALNERLNELFK